MARDSLLQQLDDTHHNTSQLQEQLSAVDDKKQQLQDKLLTAVSDRDALQEKLTATVIETETLQAELKELKKRSQTGPNESIETVTEQSQEEWRIKYDELYAEIENRKRSDSQNISEAEEKLHCVVEELQKEAETAKLRAEEYHLAHQALQTEFLELKMKYDSITHSTRSSISPDISGFIAGDSLEASDLKWTTALGGFKEERYLEPTSPRDSHSEEFIDWKVRYEAKVVENEMLLKKLEHHEIDLHTSLSDDFSYYKSKSDSLQSENQVLRAKLGSLGLATEGTPEDDSVDFYTRYESILQENQQLKNKLEMFESLQPLEQKESKVSSSRKSESDGNKTSKPISKTGASDNENVAKEVQSSVFDKFEHTQSGAIDAENNADVDWCEKCKKLNEEKKQIRKVLEDTRSSYQTELQKIQTTVKQLEQYKEKVQPLLKSGGEGGQAFVDLRSKYCSMVEENNALQEEIDGYRSRSGSELERLESEHAFIMKENEDLQAILEEVKSKYEQKINGLKEQLDTVTKEKEIRVSELEERVQEVMEDFTILQNEHAELVQEHSDLNESMDEDKEETKKGMKTVREKYDSLHFEHKRLQSMMDRERESAEREISSLCGQVDGLRKEQHNIRTMHEQEKEELQREIGGLEKLLNDADKEREEFEEMLLQEKNKAEINIKELQELYEASQNENTALCNQFALDQQEMTNYVRELERRLESAHGRSPSPEKGTPTDEVFMDQLNAMLTEELGGSEDQLECMDQEKLVRIAHHFFTTARQRTKHASGLEGELVARSNKIAELNTNIALLVSQKQELVEYIKEINVRGLSDVPTPSFLESDESPTSLRHISEADEPSSSADEEVEMFEDFTVVDVNMKPEKMNYSQLLSLVYKLKSQVEGRQRHVSELEVQLAAKRNKIAELNTDVALLINQVDELKPKSPDVKDNENMGKLNSERRHSQENTDVVVKVESAETVQMSETVQLDNMTLDVKTSVRKEEQTVLASNVVQMVTDKATQMSMIDLSDENGKIDSEVLNAWKQRCKLLEGRIRELEGKLEEFFEQTGVNTATQPVKQSKPKTKVKPKKDKGVKDIEPVIVINVEESQSEQHESSSGEDEENGVETNTGNEELFVKQLSTMMREDGEDDEDSQDEIDGELLQQMEPTTLVDMVQELQATIKEKNTQIEQLQSKQKDPAFEEFNSALHEKETFIAELQEQIKELSGNTRPPCFSPESSPERDISKLEPMLPEESADKSLADELMECVVGPAHVEVTHSHLTQVLDSLDTDSAKEFNEQEMMQEELRGKGEEPDDLDYWKKKSHDLTMKLQELQLLKDAQDDKKEQEYEMEQRVEEAASLRKQSDFLCEELEKLRVILDDTTTAKRFLQVRVDEMENAFNERSNEVTSALENSISEKEQLSERVKELEMMLDSIQTNHETRSNQLRELTEKQNAIELDLQNQVSVLKDELQKSETLINEYKMKLDKKEKAGLEQSANTEETVSHFASPDLAQSTDVKEMTSVTEWQKKLKDQLDMALGKIKEYKTKLVATEEDKKCLEQELDDSYSERDEREKMLKSQLVNVRSEFEDLQSKYDDLIKEKENVALELENVQSERTAEKEALIKECENLTKQVKRLEEEILALNKKETELKETFDNSEEQWKEKCGQLKSQMIELTTQNTKLNQALQNSSDQSSFSAVGKKRVEMVEAASNTEEEYEVATPVTESVRRLEDLEGQVISKSKEIYSLQEKNEELERQYEEMEEVLNQQAEEFDRRYNCLVEDHNILNKRLTSLLNDLDKAEEESNKKNAEIKKLEEKYEERAKDNDVLQVDLFKESKKYDELREEYRLLIIEAERWRSLSDDKDREIDGLNQEVLKWQMAEDQMRLKYNDRGHDMDAAQALADDRMDELEKLQDKHETLNNKLKVRDLEYQDLLEDMENMEQTVRDSNARCTELEEFTERCRIKTEEVEIRDKEREEEHEKIVAKMAEIQAEKDHHDHIVNGLNGDLENMRSLYEETVNCLEAERVEKEKFEKNEINAKEMVTAKESENESLLENIKKLEENKLELVQSIEEQTNKIANLEATLSEATGKCLTLEKENENLKALVLSTASEKMLLEKDFKEKQVQNDEMRVTTENLKCKCVQTEAELVKCKSDIEILEKDIEESHLVCEGLKYQNDELAMKCENVGKDSSKQVKIITEKDLQLANLQNQLDIKNKDYEEMNKAEKEKSETVEMLSNKCEHLETQLVQLNQEIKCLKTEMDEKGGEIDKLLTEKVNSKTTLEEVNDKFEKEKADLENQSSDIKDQLEKTQAAEMELKAENENLIKCLESETQELKNAQEEKEAIKNEKTELEKHYCEINKHLEEKCTAISKLEDKLSEKENSLKELSCKVKTISEDLGSKYTEIADLAEKLNLTKEKANEVENEKMSQVSLLSNENSKLSSELEAVRIEREQLQQCLHETGANKDKMYTDVTETCSQLRQELDMVNRDKAMLEEKLTNQSKESEQITNELQAKLTEKCEECERLSARSSNLETEKDNLTCKYSSLEEEILVFHTKVKELEIDKDTINKDNENLGDEIVRLKDVISKQSLDLENYGSELSEKDVALQTCNSELFVCREELDKLQKSEDVLNNDLAMIKEEKMKLHEKIDQILSEKEVADRKISDLEKELENRAKDVVDLQSKFKSVTVERGKLVKKLNKAKEEIGDLKEKLSEMDIEKPMKLDVSTDSLDENVFSLEMEQCKNELEETRQELFSLQEKYKHLEEELQHRISNAELNEKVDKAEGIVVNNEELVKQLEADIQVKCQEVQDLKIQCDQLRSSIGKDIIPGEDDSEMVIQLKSQVTSLQLYITQLQKEKASRNDPKLLTELSDINSSLNTQVTSLKSLVASLQDENDQLKIENAKYRYEEENRKIQEVMLLDRQKSPSYASSPGPGRSPSYASSPVAGSLSDITEALDMVPANNTMVVQRIGSSGDDIDKDSIVSMESIETITIKKQTVATYRGSPPEIINQPPVDSRVYEEMKIKYDTLLKEYESLKESLKQEVTSDEDITNVWQDRYDKSVKEVENLKLQLWEQKDMAANLDKNYQTRKAELETEVTFSVKSKGELEETVKQLEAKLKKVEDLEKSYDKLEDEKGQVETELSNIKIVHEHEKEKLNQKILDMDETIEAHKTAKCMVEQELNDRQYEYEQALNKAREQQSESEKSESSRIKELLLQLDETEKTVFDWKEKHRKVFEENDLLSLRLQHVVKDRELYENYVQNLEAELAVQRDQIRETIRENRDTLRELGEVRQELEFLQVERNCELNQPEAPSAKSSSTWLGFGDDSKILSGLGPDQDGHKAFEIKHFQLIEELKTLESQQKQDKEIYEQQLRHLREELEKAGPAVGDAGEELVELQEEAAALRTKLASLQETNRLLLQEKEDLKDMLHKQEQVRNRKLILFIKNTVK